MTTELYTGDKACEGTAATTVKLEFDKCSKFGDTYVKLTGATAIKAAAFAVAAFAASQFWDTEIRQIKEMNHQ